MRIIVIILSLCISSCMAFYNVRLKDASMVLSKDKSESGYIIAGALMNHTRMDPDSLNLPADRPKWENFLNTQITMYISNIDTNEKYRLNFLLGPKSKYEITIYKYAFNKEEKLTSIFDYYSKDRNKFEQNKDNPYYLIKVKPSTYKLTEIIGTCEQEYQNFKITGELFKKDVSQLLRHEFNFRVEANQIIYIGDYFTAISTYYGSYFQANSNSIPFGYHNLFYFYVQDNFDAAKKMVLEKIREAKLNYDPEIISIVPPDAAKSSLY
jgi:hypothetical protein